MDRILDVCPGTRWDGLAADGRTVPRSAGLRLDDLARRNGKENNERQFRSTRERARTGKASEPRPRRRKWGAR